MRPSLLALVFISLPGILSAQTETFSLFQNLTPVGAAPADSPNAYHLSNFEHYNPFTGALNPYLPIYHVGGRGGAGFDIVVPLDLWTHWEDVVSYIPNSSGPPGSPQGPPITHQPTVNFRFIYPGLGPGGVFGRTAANTIPCSEPQYGHLLQNTVTRLTFMDSTGTQTELIDQATGGKPFYPTPGCSGVFPAPPSHWDAQRGIVYLSHNGSETIEFVSDSVVYDYDPSDPVVNAGLPIPVSGYLHLPNGVIYRIDNSSVTSITDRNGNQITFKKDPSGNGNTDVLDQNGRQITIGPNSLNAQATSVAYLTSGGTQTVTINTESLGNVLRCTSCTPETLQQLFGNDAGLTSGPFNPSVINSIVLPDGSQYSFKYDVYAELAQVTLPTGGVIQYDWGDANNGQTDGFYFSSTQLTPGFVARRLQERREYSDGVTLSSRTHYTVSENGSGQSVKSSVSDATYDQAVTYDAAGNIVGQTIHKFYGVATDAPLFDPVIGEPWNEGLEYETDYGVSNQAALKTVGEIYNQSPTPWCISQNLCTSGTSPANNPHPTTKTTTLNDVSPTLVSQVSYLTFDVHNNLTDETESDWGSGSPGAILRETKSVFLPVANSGYSSSQWSPNASYITTFPTSRTLFNGTGTQIAQTTWGYDEAQTQPQSSIVNHDDTNFGTGQTNRGNLTSETRWLNITGGPVVSRLEYDVAGNVLKATDANGNATTYTYNDSNNTFAHVISTTNVIGKTSATYDLNSGKILTFTDLNGVTESYSYEPYFDRIQQIIRGGSTGSSGSTAQTNYGYPSLTEIDSYQDQNTPGDKRLAHVQLFDGFQRPTIDKQFDNQNPSTLVESKKTYNALELLASQSNPAANDAGLSVAKTYLYDTLGRETTVTAADGVNTAQTSYRGNQTTTTDPYNVQKARILDGLGRLQQVLEYPVRNSTATVYSAQYTYDALGNLTAVAQTQVGSTQSCPAQPPKTGATAGCRYFSYDSLGRLGYSVQSETGTINMRYDANGNVIWKDDNAGRQTCYSYDALNRNTAKVYFVNADAAGASGNCAGISPGNLMSNTPAVTYVYDSALLGKGRLGQVSAAGVSSTTIAGYDTLGQITGSSQATAGQTFTFSYGHNLAGALTTEVYPSGRIVTNTYDGLNRTSAVAAEAQTIASGITYAPHGGISSLEFGNGLSRNMAYNLQLQPEEITDTMTSQSACAGGSAQYTGQSAYVLDLQLFWGGTSGQTSQNNGNLQGELIQTCNGSGFTVAENYSEAVTYDGMNRISTFGDNGGGTTSTRTFSYDLYGNMWANDSSGSLFPVLADMPTSNSVYLNSSNQSYNRRTDFTYDAAGNQQTTTLCKSAACISYDGENRQTTFAESGTSYVYDGNGNRVEKIAGGVTTVYVYDAQGALTAQYSSGATATAPCSTCYLSTDHLGSIRMVTDQSGNLIARHDYMPFGEEITAGYAGRPATIGSSPSPWNTADDVEQRFTGKIRDQDSYLDYFGARYYGSALGRFTSPDEFKGGIVDPFTGQDIETNTALPYADITDPQTLNKYAYVRNNPLRYTDPNGHCVEALTCTVEFGTAGAEIGSVGGPIGTAAGALIGGAIGAFTGYEIYKGAQAVVSLATNNSSSQQGQPSAAPSGQSNGSKSAEEMASDLKDKIGKNSVPYDTPSSKGRIDLAGKGHFDKATGQVVDTPHVQEGTKSVGPNGEVNIGNKTVRPATKQDIRTAEKLAKQKGWLQE